MAKTKKDVKYCVLMVYNNKKSKILSTKLIKYII